jgi:hypothetical protein
MHMTVDYQNVLLHTMNAACMVTNNKTRNRHDCGLVPTPSEH